MKLGETELSHILKLWNVDHKSVSEISKLTGRAESTIRRALKNNGIILKNMGFGLEFSEDQKALIVQKYAEGISTVDIAKHFGVCDRTIATYLRKWGIVVRNSGYHPKILNEAFFEDINTEEKAYFLGLLMADGCVMDNNTFSLSLSSPDEYLIRELISAIGYYQPIVNKSSLDVKYKLKNVSRYDNNGGNPKFNVIMHSSKICDDLKRYGIIPRKSLNVQFPKNIPEIYLRHFIRGFFDGNGTVFKNGKSTRVAIYSQPLFLNSLQDALAEVGMSRNAIYTQKNTKISFISYGKQSDIKLFYHYLYDDATICMIRKKEKFEY